MKNISVMRISNKVQKTTLEGLKIINRSKNSDERGSFTNLFKDIKTDLVWGERPIKQVNLSETVGVGTIRGMHLQKNNSAEAKLVTCLQGAVFDVAVDLRRNSKTFGKWFGLELTADSDRSFFIPEGFAHGFQVLKPNTQLLYCHSMEFSEENQFGVHPIDEEIKINWPLKCSLLSARDSKLPSLREYNEIVDEMQSL